VANCPTFLSFVCQIPPPIFSIGEASTCQLLKSPTTETLTALGAHTLKIESSPCKNEPKYLWASLIDEIKGNEFSIEHFEKSISALVASTIGQIYQHEMIPNTAKGNVNGGDINTSHKMNLFHFYKMSIKSEYAKIIDKYFDMFGYKVNMLKVPNKNHRARYWFTKTIDVNINGAIPNDDLQQIKNCYNNGITFWRSDSEVDNYNVTNNII
jgi:hypothetical protein